MSFCLVGFFFKQKTAYDMLISYWSSDVCSSDLIRLQELHVIIKRIARRVVSTKIRLPALLVAVDEFSRRGRGRITRPACIGLDAEEVETWLAIGALDRVLAPAGFERCLRDQHACRHAQFTRGAFGLREACLYKCFRRCRRGTARGRRAGRGHGLIRILRS